MSGKTAASASHCKQHIIDSLNRERWSFGEREGLLRFRTVLVHPTAEGVVVTRLGSVFLHGMRVSWPSHCIRKAVKRQLLTHLHCDLTGAPENNR